MLLYTTVYGNRVYFDALYKHTNFSSRVLAIASKTSYEQNGKRAQHDKNFQCGFVLPLVAFPQRLYFSVTVNSTFDSQF